MFPPVNNAMNTYWVDPVHRPRDEPVLLPPSVTNEIPWNLIPLVAPVLLHFIDRTATVRPYVPAGFLVPVKEKLLPGLYNRITRTWSLCAPDQKFIPMLLAVCVGVYKDFSCFNPQKLVGNKVPGRIVVVLCFINNAINLLRWGEWAKRASAIHLNHISRRDSTNALKLINPLMGFTWRRSAGEFLDRSLNCDLEPLKLSLIEFRDNDWISPGGIS